METALRRRGGRQRDASRQAAILDATREVLVEEGFEGLTIDAVARRAGASRSTIYRWWDTPAELVISALEARLGSEVEQPDTGSLAGDLRAFLASYAATEADDRAGLWAAMVHALSRDPALREEVRARLVDKQEVAVLVGILQRAQQRGEVSPAVDPSLLREVMTAVVSTRTVVMAAALDEAYIDHAVDDVLVPVLRAAG